MARPRSDIQPRIVRAARARFLADGVDGASLREIARAARTNIGMIFYYFPTKDDLFLAVVEEVYGALLEDISGVVARDAPLEERLRDVSKRLGHATDAELDVVRLVVREALLSGARFKRLLARFQRGHLALLLGALADGVARGEVDDTVPLPVLLLVTMGVVGVPQMVRRVAARAAPFDAVPQVDELADLVVRVLFRGVGRARRRKRSILRRR